MLTEHASIMTRDHQRTQMQSQRSISLTILFCMLLTSCTNHHSTARTDPKSVFYFRMDVRDYYISNRHTTLHLDNAHFAKQLNTRFLSVRNWDTHTWDLYNAELNQVASDVRTIFAVNNQSVIADGTIFGPPLNPEEQAFAESVVSTQLRWLESHSIIWARPKESGLWHAYSSTNFKQLSEGYCNLELTDHLALVCTNLDSESFSVLDHTLSSLDDNASMRTQIAGCWWVNREFDGEELIAADLNAAHLETPISLDLDLASPFEINSSGLILSYVPTPESNNDGNFELIRVYPKREVLATVAEWSHIAMMHSANLICIESPSDETTMVYDQDFNHIMKLPGRKLDDLRAISADTLLLIDEDDFELITLP